MSKLVLSGTMLKCSQGMAPSKLMTFPTNRVEGIAEPVATVMDRKPIANIAPFALCRSLANPQVATATAAAMGVLTPQPCLPVVPGPWTPGTATVEVGPFAALTDTSTCQCTWTGIIEVLGPGADDLTAE